MLLLLALLLASQPEPLNPAFEEGEIGRVPPGWNSPSAQLFMDGTRKCAAVSHVPPFGNLMQVLDATPYRGKAVRFRAAVRTDGISRAQLWLRVDRPGGIGFFDNMDDRPILSRQWAEYTIEGNIASDATAINIGVMAVRPDSIWIDDVIFEITGEAKALPAEPPRPLSRQGLRNLTAFARLLGYVRYFHPSDQAAAADWNRFAIEGVRRVEEAPDLVASLREVFAPVAPAVQIFPTGGKAAPVDTAAQMIRWSHHGLGTGQPGIYRSKRQPDLNAPAPYAADLGAGVSCLVPLGLPTPPEGRDPGPPRPPGQWTANDRATRLADVILAWNVFQHFYPYFDVVAADWPRELETALASAATDKDEKAFLRTLERMVAGLHDGHGNVFLGGTSGFAVPPMLWEWVEGKLVVTHAPGGEVSRGDLVLAIDGRPVADVLREQEALISGATPQWIRRKALRQMVAGDKDTSIALRVDPWNEPGKVRDVKMTRVLTAVPEPRPDKVAELEPGIFYIDINRIDDSDWSRAIPKLASAKGIVFDFRGYPGKLRNVSEFFGHLSKEPMTSAQWHVPILPMPDRQGMTFERAGEWRLPLAEPYLAAKKAFLTFGGSISYAESCMGIVEHYKLGEIVGEATAGTNGNINPFVLAGGYRVTWTGMKVLKQDGSRHHGVGILPTIPVARTRAGIAAGRDEILERGIQAVRQP